MLALRSASETLHPALLSGDGVDRVVRKRFGNTVPGELSDRLRAASGGNPFYLTELLRDVAPDGGGAVVRLPDVGIGSIVERVVARVLAVDPGALGLAQAVAVLGDGCQLRQAAAVAGMPARGHRAR